MSTFIVKITEPRVRRPIVRHAVVPAVDGFEAINLVKNYYGGHQRGWTKGTTFVIEKVLEPKQILFI